MAAISKNDRSARLWHPACLAAIIAVAGALAMTVILAAAALASAAVRGLPPAELPLLLTADSMFPRFCATAGVVMAVIAGYCAIRGDGGVTVLQSVVAGVLTVVGHTLIIFMLGSPLSPAATALYVALTLPAVCLGCYLGSPAKLRPQA
jgi:hypothetical protein